MSTNSKKIAVIGLGYVGLPLAVEFAKKFEVVGLDINESRIAELKTGHDSTLEVEDELLQAVLLKNGQVGNADKGLTLASTPSAITDCNVYIVTVPTPTDKNNRPVLTPMIKASESIGNVLKKGDIVIYESTVYPGVTEDECVPVLEKTSGLTYNVDFFVGYSPERINPGDKKHTVTKILKVTSGSTPEIAEEVDQLYKSVITAGTHKAPSIKVAEAAKVIENSQRDINIAFVNELAKIFNLMDIDTSEVLEAAGTKWNFLPFRPGLVGGHCIGVDPYYLAQKAQEVGYHPEIILAGRRLNDGMGQYVATEVVKMMLKADLTVKGSNILMLGITFKENCPDIRNTRAIDIYTELLSYDINIDVYDPWADAQEVEEEFGLNLTAKENLATYDTIILAVAHKEFLDEDISIWKKPNGLVYDVKSILPKDLVNKRL
ncbi:MAG: nucleotide sugar dehydrogenase [Flammeovirgaceae bacterium]